MNVQTDTGRPVRASRREWAELAVLALPGPLAAAVSTAARLAFTSGLHAISLATAAVLGGTAVLIATGLRHLPLRGGGSE